MFDTQFMICIFLVLSNIVHYVIQDNFTI